MDFSRGGRQKAPQTLLNFKPENVREKKKVKYKLTSVNFQQPIMLKGHIHRMTLTVKQNLPHN